MTANKNGFKNSGKTVLDVLVTVEVPKAKKEKGKRKPLNISLVLDRSGSMREPAQRLNMGGDNGIVPSVFGNYQHQMYGGSGEGSKMTFAVNAAISALELMEENDRISVVAFDDVIDVVTETTLLKGREKEIEQKIRAIQPRNSTNLHGGWVEGGKQIARNLDKEHLNRVIVLTDGQANMGKTGVDEICTDVSALKDRHISTTTLGVGLSFNEVLLQKMAESGEGNYYYIEQISQLEKLFVEEFRAMSNMHGQRVRLGVQEKAGVKLLESYNEFKKDGSKYILPNLIKGRSVEFMFSIEVSAKNVVGEELIEFELTWDKEGAENSQKAVLSLPSLSKEDFKVLKENEEVVGKKAVLIAAREREKALESLNRGDIAGSKGFLRSASQILSAAPVMACTSAAFAETSRTIDMSERGDIENLKKVASYQNYNARNSKES